MTSLDKARQGRSAARQLRSLFRADALSPADMLRLLDKIDDGFDQMLGPVGEITPQPRRPFAPIVHDGGRA